MRRVMHKRKKEGDIMQKSREITHWKPKREEKDEWGQEIWGGGWVETVL
jgi:hypothetical protein